MRKMIDSNFYKIFLWILLFMMAIGIGMIMFNLSEPQDLVPKVWIKNL